MATEKDKMIASAMKRYSGGCGCYMCKAAKQTFGELWEAARADAIEECATKIERDWPTSDTAKTIADRVRSLSRKQEEPR